ncbi:MAG: helix-hairpin-helix domain-containing protein [Actinomycetaceae bacterium]|nr:helix-hairpin-helix domain-containing protein [Actinomycetaceae bacterium]
MYKIPPKRRHEEDFFFESSSEIPHFSACDVIENNDDTYGDESLSSFDFDEHSNEGHHEDVHKEQPSAVDSAKDECDYEHKARSLMHKAIEDAAREEKKEGKKKSRFLFQGASARAVLIGVLLLGSLWGGYLYFSSSSSHDDTLSPQSHNTVVASDDEERKNQTKNEYVVYITGAVKKPGVYTLQADARVNDGVQAAGGLAAEADEQRINLAAELTDGMHIHIVKKGEEITTQEQVDSQNSASSVSSGGNDGKVNINSSNEETLQNLPGIGPSIAKAIVEWRTKNGKFSSIEELTNVPGIGEGRLEKIRDKASV